MKKRKRQPGQWFDGVQRGYTRLLKNLYRFKKSVLFVAVLAIVGAFSLVSTLNTDLFSAEDFSYFTIDIATPIGSSISSTDSVVRQFEEVLLQKIGKGEVVSISSSVGASSGFAAGASSNLAKITVDLFEVDEGRERSIDEIIEACDIPRAEAEMLVMVHKQHS